MKKPTTYQPPKYHAPKSVSTNPNAVVANGKPFKLLIGIPCADMMHTDFVRCLLALNRPGDSTILFIKGTILPQSRDTIASTAIK